MYARAAKCFCITLCVFTRKHRDSYFCPFISVTLGNDIEIIHGLIWRDRHSSFEFKFNHPQRLFASTTFWYVHVEYVRRFFWEGGVCTIDAVPFLLEMDEGCGKCRHILDDSLVDDPLLKRLVSVRENVPFSILSSEHEPFYGSVGNVNAKRSRQQQDRKR